MHELGAAAAEEVQGNTKNKKLVYLILIGRAVYNVGQLYLSSKSVLDTVTLVRNFQAYYDDWDLPSPSFEYCMRS